MKLLLLGLSGSGKSTVAKLLAGKYKLSLYEADDEVMKANGGVWPKDDANFDDFVDRVFEETNKKVINLENIIYVISWMEKERIEEFYNNGFVIVEMHADFDELIKRKELRDGISEIRRNRFSNTYISYFETILSDDMKDFYKLSIDTTNKSPNELANIITQHILP